MGASEAILMTNCIITRENSVLLGMKKRGFGMGRWNGFGGKLREGESLQEGALRELQEESGLRALSLEEMGVLLFEQQDIGALHEMHIFLCKDFQGSPVETEEMRPQWFSRDEIPYEDMWADDRYWLPLFLEGKKFSGRFVFKDKDTLISHSLSINT